jgi:TetR/AcrR family transcriptional regulator, mexJK operon transcriptional repressor
VKARQGRRGRPSREDAARLEDHILDVAAGLFLAAGYGDTSIDLLARRARMTKRTIYNRFRDKAAVFTAVIQRIVDRLRPPDVESLFAGDDMQEVLLRVCKAILHAALQPEALALHRVIVAEAGRFPELAAMVASRPGSQEAIRRIAVLLLGNSARRRDTAEAEFAAAQLLQMTIASPQRRALGGGPAMSPAELDEWAERTVGLFLNGWLGLNTSSTKGRARSRSR